MCVCVCVSGGGATFQADAKLLYKKETAASVAQQLCFTSSAETE